MEMLHHHGAKGLQDLCLVALLWWLRAHCPDLHPLIGASFGSCYPYAIITVLCVFSVEFLPTSLWFTLMPLRRTHSLCFRSRVSGRQLLGYLDAFTPCSLLSLPLTLNPHPDLAPTDLTLYASFLTGAF